MRVQYLEYEKEFSTENELKNFFMLCKKEVGISSVTIEVCNIFQEEVNNFEVWIIQYFTKKINHTKMSNNRMPTILFITSDKWVRLLVFRIFLHNYFALYNQRICTFLYGKHNMKLLICANID